MNQSYSLSDLITSVKGIGPATSEKLDRLGIETIGDLFHHYPSRYLDFTTPVKIHTLKDKQAASFIATIENVKSFFTRSRKLITQATAKDETGKIKLTWFNNPYIKKMIVEGEKYSIAGKPSLFGPSLTIVSPMLEEGDSFSINTKGLVPVYPQTAGITSKWLRTKIYALLSETTFRDPVPQEELSKNELIDLSRAYSLIHFPPEKKERWKADKRLAYNEHLLINIKNKLEQTKLGSSVRIKTSVNTHKQTQKRIPFVLTSDQEKAVEHIYKDLQNPEFTHRLIQGDTGSGKTVTLIFAADQCLVNKLSCAIMAPTEILARQHFQTFSSLSSFPDSVQLITGSIKAPLNSDKPQIYIGTHALLTQLPAKLKYPLAFVAIDEQHKFGVSQRETLMQRSPLPHLFNLSATPIPRTVALGLLGDIETSNISHKPLNRLPIKTFVINQERYQNSTDWMTEKLAEGNQVFVVCPNITDHDNQIASVEKIAQKYRQKYAKNYPVWEIHGRLKPEEQQHIISEFKTSGKGILVSTSLIEVGIDIPAANIMVIHSAERFGLAQLHQLRGRVGRGQGQGFCFLVPTGEEETETERLQLLQKYDNGLVLAQKDLRLRGAGEVFGIRQHGVIPTRLKYFWSKKLFLTAKKDAQKIIDSSKDNAQKIAAALSSC